MFFSHIFFSLIFRTEDIKDLGYKVKFNLLDEATLADWKGKDLRQAKSIPNIDILILAVRKVSKFSAIEFGRKLQSSAHGLRTHDGSIPNSLRPKFKFQSQINIWNLDIKVYFFFVDKMVG